MSEAAVTTGACARHPLRSAIGTCTRCGNFYCADCYKDLAGRRLCAACLELPGVNYLKAMRDAYWGTRDGWVWYFGLLASLGELAVAARDANLHNWVTAFTGLVSFGLCVGYLLLQPWARLGLFLLVPLAVIRSTWAHHPDGVSTAYMLGTQLVGVLISLLFIHRAYNSSRNKLAFRIELSDLELQKLYDRYSNADATRALVYGLLSAMPLVGIVGLIFGVRALRRTAPDAWPPVKGRTTAIIGIVLSLLGTAAWGLAAIWAVAPVFRR